MEDDGSKLQRGDIIVHTVVCQKGKARHQKVEPPILKQNLVKTQVHLHSPLPFRSPPSITP